MRGLPQFSGRPFIFIAMKDYYTHPHESKRLTMRPLTLEDAEVWNEFMNSPHATILFPEYLKPPKFSGKDWIEKQLLRYKNQQLGLLALVEKSSGEFVGQCGLLKQTVNGVDEVEVGYHLLPRFWKQGFAREAALYFINYGFETLNCPSIISLINTRNLDSQKVAFANGLKNTGEIIDNHGDSYIFRISRSDHQFDTL